MNKIKTYITLTILTLSLGVTQISHAAVEHLNLPVCNLAVYPYNPTAQDTLGSAGTNLLNYLGESICKARTPYGSSYIQPPKVSENPLKNISGITDKKVPYAIHQHSYINSSLEDNFYYRSYIDKFEIKLQSDALNNTEKTQVQCQTPAPSSFKGSAEAISDCNGEIKDPNFYGGVKVTYNSNTGVILWEFGTVDKSFRPNMWGNNDSNPSDSDNFNESLAAFFGVSANLNDYNSVYRKFTPSVQLKTKNNNSEIWSATTTSRILIRNYAISKASFNQLALKDKFTSLCTTANDYSKWCPLPTPSGQNYQTVQLGSSGQQQWFWFPIGSVVSVWNKPETTQPPTCKELTLTYDILEANKPINFTVIPTVDPKNANLPLNYNWTATNTNNPTKTGGFKDKQDPNIKEQNNFIDKDTNTYYTGGAGETKITVQAQSPDGKTKYDKCTVPLIIPKEEEKPPVCTGLTITPTTLEANKPTTFTVTPTFSPSNQSIKLKYNWSTTNNSGKFKDKEGDPDSIAKNPFVDENTSTYYSGGEPGTQINVIAEGENNIPIPACSAIVKIPPKEEKKVCKILKVDIFDKNNNLTNQNSLQEGESYTITINATQSLFNNGEQIKNYDIVVTGPLNNMGTLTKIGNDSKCEEPHSSGNEITVIKTPVDCKYNYIPKKDNTLRVQANPHDNIQACKITKTVTPKEEKKVCEDLNFEVNGNKSSNPQIEAGENYNLKVNPKYNNGEDISLVIWSVFGDGVLVGNTNNILLCPAKIDKNSPLTVLPYICDYQYQAPSNSNNPFGFKVSAVPHNNNPACTVQTKNYQPPKDENPYCLYLDLDTSGTFNPLESNNMNATVVLSDGSQYQDQVAFKSLDNSGNFSGGYGKTSEVKGIFLTSVDNTNNTRNVNFINGNQNTSLNIFLANTNIQKSTACLRALYPKPTEDNECKIPPKIERKGNVFIASGGDSSEYCWSVSGPNNPLFTNGQYQETGKSVQLQGFYTNFNIEVHDCNRKYANLCQDKKTYSDTPEIKKEIRPSGQNNYTTKINLTTKGDNISHNIDYKLTFTPSNYNEGYMIASVYDPAFTGKINASKQTTETSVKGGEVEIKLKDIKVTQLSNNYTVCKSDPSPKDQCYQLDQKNGKITINGINSTDPIEITYSGSYTPNISLKECQEGEACNEKVINQSYVTEFEYCVENTETDKDGKATTTYDCTKAPATKNLCQEIEQITEQGTIEKINPCKEDQLTITSNKTTIETVCQYFLTRAAGDVFLEEDLKYGFDISKCYPRKNNTGPIIKPKDEGDRNIVRSGQTENNTITISHEICTAGQNDFKNMTNLSSVQKEILQKLYGSDISKNLSSQICEVSMVPGLVWTKDQINNSIKLNIDKLTRWNSGINPSSKITQLTDIKFLNKTVYYYKGSGSGSETVTINKLEIPEGSGAMTVIIEDADLQINGNIQYTGQDDPNLSADQISSLGVIVLNGNMYVDPNVEKLAGAYFIQREDENDMTKGNIFSGTKNNPQQYSDKFLTINGSIYGNIGPLMQHRLAAGDATQDEGSITIRYDQRMIQNTPPGLSELFGNFSQTQIAN